MPTFRVRWRAAKLGGRRSVAPSPWVLLVGAARQFPMLPYRLPGTAITAIVVFREFPTRNILWRRSYTSGLPVFVPASLATHRQWVQVMSRQSATSPPQAAESQDMLHAATYLGNKDDHCTLILDHAGRILNCGLAAEIMFQARQVQLIGRQIQELIVDLFRAGSSPSYCARYFACLCADGEWRKFKAIDASGHQFAAEIKMSRRITDGQEIFLINVRHPEKAACP